MATIGMSVPRNVVEKMKAGEKLTEEDVNSVIDIGPVCSVCGEAVDTTKAVGDGEGTSLEELSNAEVIVYGREVWVEGELMSASCRRYHGDYYWNEAEELDAAEERAASAD